MAKTKQQKYKEKFPENYPKVILLFGSSFNQKLYNFENNVKELVYCQTCKIKTVRFVNYNYGYKIYCSTCAHSAPGVLEKRQATSKEKYGEDNVSKSPKVQKKTRETNLKKYGVTNPNKLKWFKDKIKSNYKEKYGVESHFQIPAKKEEINSIIREIYGDHIPMRVPSLKKDIEQTNKERYDGWYLGSKENRERISTPEAILKANLTRFKHFKENYGVLCSMQIPEVLCKINMLWNERYGGHPRTSQIVKDKIKATNLLRHGVPWCCLLSDHKSSSKYEKLLRKVLNCSKKRVGGYEFDIYLEKENALLEIDGEYWHVDTKPGMNFIQLYNFANDYLKESKANTLGYKVYRIKYSIVKMFLENNQLLVFDDIVNFCYTKEYNFQPLPLILNSDYVLREKNRIRKKSEQTFNTQVRGALKYTNELLGKNYKTCKDLLKCEYNIE